MVLENDVKFEEKLICGFENDTRHLTDFHQSTGKSQNLDVDVILLSKLENIWAENFHGSYVS